MLRRLQLVNVATQLMPLRGSRRIVCSHGHDLSHHAAEPPTSGEHTAACKRVTLCGAALNITLCTGKLALGGTGVSTAMFADGLHALMDVLCDLVSFTAVSLSTRPVAKHLFPFGIGRVETAGAVAVSFMLLWSGVFLLVNAVRRLVFGESKPSAIGGGCSEEHHDHHGHSHDCSAHGHSHLPELVMMSDEGKPVILWTMVGVSSVAIASKLLMYRWAADVGRRAGSAVVVANGFHHRADALISSVTFVGVLGAAAGFPALDDIAGVAVAGTVVSTASRLLLASALEFFDFQAKTLLSMRETAYPVPRGPNLATVVNVFATRHGRKLAIHGTVLMRDHESAATLHATTAEMSAAFRKQFPGAEVLGPYLSFVKLQPSAAAAAAAVEQHGSDCCGDTNASAGVEAGLTLSECLKLVLGFHGACEVDSDAECKLVIVPQSLLDDPKQKDCLADIVAVAACFGFTVEGAPKRGNNGATAS